MFINEGDASNVALEKYESMLKSNRVVFFDTTEFEGIIQHYLDDGNFQKAKKALQIALDQHPKTTELQLLQVEIFIFEDQLDKAEDLIATLESIEASNEDILVQKAAILSKKNLHKEAIEVLKSTLELTLEPENIHMLIGMEFLFIDNFLEAQKEFEKCVYHDPTDYTSFHNLMNCYHFLEDYNGAINFLKKYIDQNPYSELAWHQLGIQYKKIQKFEEALEAFEYAIISDDRFVGAYVEKGILLEQKGNYLEAIENFLISTKLEDPTSFALLHIGLCYNKLGNDIEALKYLHQTVHEDPLLDKGWAALTKLYYKKEMYREALSTIQKALEIDSENPDYWLITTNINILLDRIEQTNYNLNKCIELGVDTPEIWMQRSQVLLDLDENEVKYTALKLAKNLNKSHSKIIKKLKIIGGDNKNQSSTIGIIRNSLSNYPYLNTIFKEIFPELKNSKK